MAQSSDAAVPGLSGQQLELLSGLRQQQLGAMRPHQYPDGPRGNLPQGSSLNMDIFGVTAETKQILDALAYAEFSNFMSQSAAPAGRPPSTGGSGNGASPSSLPTADNRIFSLGASLSGNGTSESLQDAFLPVPGLSGLWPSFGTSGSLFSSNREQGAASRARAQAHMAQLTSYVQKNPRQPLQGATDPSPPLDSAYMHPAPPGRAFAPQAPATHSLLPATPALRTSPTGPQVNEQSTWPADSTQPYSLLMTTSIPMQFPLPGMMQAALAAAQAAPNSRDEQHTHASNHSMEHQQARRKRPAASQAQLACPQKPQQASAQPTGAAANKRANVHLMHEAEEDVHPTTDPSCSPHSSSLSASPSLSVTQSQDQKSNGLPHTCAHAPAAAAGKAKTPKGRPAAAVHADADADAASPSSDGDNDTCHQKYQGSSEAGSGHEQGQGEGDAGPLAATPAAGKRSGAGSRRGHGSGTVVREGRKRDNNREAQRRFRARQRCVMDALEAEHAKQARHIIGLRVQHALLDQQFKRLHADYEALQSVLK